MNTSPPVCYGAVSGPVTITAHGGGDDTVLPLITLGYIPASGAALAAHARACLAELDLLADDD
jgi:hypothetical protein